MLDYEFKDINLFRQAITHPSYKKNEQFERLEFVGDRVLGMIIAEELYTSYPKAEEGELAKRLASLVCKETCLQIARKISLSEVIKAQNPEHPSILADSMEALIGALFFDAGWQTSKEIIKGLWKKHLNSEHYNINYKSLVQEWVQKKGLGLPQYTIAHQKGPSHEPVFFVDMMVEGFESIQSSGRNKQEAEQNAASIFYEQFIITD